MRQIENEIMDVVIEVNKEAKKYLDSSSLISDGILDSLDMLHIITKLEEKYEIAIFPGDVAGRNFESISKITALVEKYI